MNQQFFGMDSSNQPLQAFQHLQKWQQEMLQNWQQAFQQTLKQSLNLLPTSTANAVNQTIPAFQFHPEKLEALRQNYLHEAFALWQKGLQGDLLNVQKDKRFSSDAWQNSSVYNWLVASYLLNSKTLKNLLETVETDEKTRARLEFAIEQWSAASSPSNFLAFNVEAQQKAIETKGKSLQKGFENLLNDLRQGHMSQTDERLFEVGQNVASTEGAVVFENDLFQLIEYKPTTEKVYERPFLLIPPCINKFYILDLQAENSFVRYSLQQGHHTFIVSWRNADASLAQKTWDNYIEDVILKAISVTQEITNQTQINTLGFCVGGTMLATALAILAARGENSVSSATFLTTLLDFSDTGILDIFIDDHLVQYREKQFAKGGILKGQELASTFSFLRPTDLVWNYVVGNYLKGETPPAFDLLYWNSDSTNLPGRFYTNYLRNTYLENNLCKPNQWTVCGESIDLSLIQTPVYLYGSREDHIVPIEGAYASTRLFSGDVRFVMGASGHIAGVINPPSKNKRSYWVNPDNAPFETHAQWMAKAQEQKGSWWPNWSNWLQSHSGKLIDAPQNYGNAAYSVIEPAPGRYVKKRI